MDLNYSVLKKVLPTLLAAYGKATGVNLVDDSIRLDDIDTLKFQLQDIPVALNELRVFIDMMLMQVNHQAMQPKLEELSIVDIMTAILIQYPFKDHEIGLVDFQFEKATSFGFNGDKLMFKHIMFNLIKNALYFIKASNKKKAEIKIWLEPGDKFNVLNFRDNGAGIPSNVLPNIFKPFYSKREGGSGVGLALCKNFMEKLGGDISCHSSEGDYTHFTLRFPKA
jgi:signal transduction histidine kinase